MKLGLYAREGVQEYWIVDPEGQTIEVCRFKVGDLSAMVTLEATDTVTSPLLPGFQCPVATLFRWP